MHDECGHYHESGLHYQWYGLSVLNEDEHHIKPDMGQAYTVCFDAIKAEVAKNNPSIIAIGPELINGAPLPFIDYFLNASNHADGLAPPITSYHWGTSATGATGSKFFTAWDGFMKSNVLPIEAMKKALSSETELVLNEYIPFVNDWCDCTGHEKLCGGNVSKSTACMPCVHCLSRLKTASFLAGVPGQVSGLAGQPDRRW